MTAAVGMFVAWEVGAYIGALVVAVVVGCWPKKPRLP